MLANMLNSVTSLSVSRDSLILDTDYDQDNYEDPDPGLLCEKNELCLIESSQVMQLFTNSQKWRTMSLQARARLLWLHLRTYLSFIVEKEKLAEMRVARLTHGLEPLRRLEVAAGLLSVAQDPVGGHFVVLDGANYLHLHTKDGWVQMKLQAPVSLTGLVVVSGPLGEVGRFVGWGPAGLAILGPDFRLLWLCQPGVGRALGQEPIYCLPVPSVGLLIVAQVGGGLELWKFRSGGRRLVPNGVPLKPPPGLLGKLKRLALGPERAHHVPNCFAACGSAVLTFDLNSWALVDVRQDLHKTTISDLAYCEGVEAMVTASRDSTVKVWEADWQIRMVFVGHTGPVTAMTVLPKSTLVVSASQDGTLRTWDLKTAAQVGEVALSYLCRDLTLRRVSRLLAPAGPGWPVLSLRSESVELWRVRDLYSPLAQLSAPVICLQVAPVLPAPAEPSLPARLICACADGSVYLLSASTGLRVSALLLGPEDCAAAVAYCLPRETLWVLTRSGHLVRANAARCPMVVQHRLPPAPPPAPQPCCLHLYSHLTDAHSAFACWKIVCQHGGNLRHSVIAWAWKNKNRYLPVMGHTDGTLSVLDWRSSSTVFRTEAHSPGPVTAIASTWNSIVSSGGDLTVKMWRVFPYAEESLSLLRTFACCHPVVTLCVLGSSITVGFEDPESATYALVQFGLGDKKRCDHRPQDDPTDHITAGAELDTFCRLLQLDGPPQNLSFCSNSGDLVLTLGSRLCLVSHRLYLPTSYLVKKLCQKAPDIVDDPPLPLTSREPLTSSQLQKLANLCGAASLRMALPVFQHQRAPFQQPVLKEDLEDLVVRDQDLQQLRQGLVVPTAQPPPSRKVHQEAFANYLHLIYGPDLLDIQSKHESTQWSILTPTMQKDPQDLCTHPRGQATFSSKAQTVPTVPSPQAPGDPGRRFARPPRVKLPIPPIPRMVHSKASQLLSRSSLSCELGLSLDLQLQAEALEWKRPMVLDTTSTILQHRIPLLLPRRPKEPPSKVSGFFPATYSSQPISFPGCVPNSVVLQQMWLSEEVGGLGSLAQISQQKRKASPSLDDPWLKHHRHSTAGWQKKLIQWLSWKPEEEEEEEEEQEYELDWSSSSLNSEEQLESGELESLAHSGSQHHSRNSLTEQRYKHLPKFLHHFVVQNWFKKLFPIFTLEAYPEMGTEEGLAIMLMDFLEKVTWADRVHILQGLLRLLPDLSTDLRSQLQGKLLYLLNLDEPPTLQDETQKQFVMLAMQLLLACTLESRDVVIELMTYFLYSPANCRSELKKMLDGLGLHDPQGLLFKEMMTWVPGPDLDSKAMVRSYCCQKLDDMIQGLQVEVLEQSEDNLSVEAPRETRTLSTSGMPSRVSEVPEHASELPLLGVLPEATHPDVAGPERQALGSLHHVQPWQPRRALSDSLQPFCLVPDAPLSSGHRALPRGRLPLELTTWSRSKMLDLYHINVLNFFCQRKSTQQQSVVEEAECPYPPQLLPPSASTTLQKLVPNFVVRPPKIRRWVGLYPILRLQGKKAQSSKMILGHRLSRHPGALDGSLRVLKLPLPRVELQPFPPGWPAPPRARPPFLLQPGLQRYFLPQEADPDTYN
uniref:WD repeat-containing protein KIAA1875-like n=1 Tax=Jaculus jaculus TaxID=51337 RepID=A0A8C5KKS9_JACJA